LTPPPPRCWAVQVDAIDQLVNGQLEQESSGYDHNINQDRCALCGGDWHGAVAPHDAGTAGDLDHQRMPGCPGALATDEQRKKWRESHQRLHRTQAASQQRLQRTRVAIDRTVVTVPRLMYALRGLPVSPGTYRQNKRRGRHRAQRGRRLPAQSTVLDR
jgi:hypothetical protein